MTHGRLIGRDLLATLAVAVLLGAAPGWGGDDDAAAQGVVVVRSTRVGSGIVRRNIELDDDKLGFVAAMELNPHKARVLLRMALTKTKDPREVQRMFEQY